MTDKAGSISPRGNPRHLLSPRSLERSSQENKVAAAARAIIASESSRGRGLGRAPSFARPTASSTARGVPLGRGIGTGRLSSPLVRTGSEGFLKPPSPNLKSGGGAETRARTAAAVHQLSRSESSAVVFAAAELKVGGSGESGEKGRHKKKKKSRLNGGVEFPRAEMQKLNVDQLLDQMESQARQKVLSFLSAASGADSSTGSSSPEESISGAFAGGGSKNGVDLEERQKEDWTIEELNNFFHRQRPVNQIKLLEGPTLTTTVLDAPIASTGLILGPEAIADIEDWPEILTFQFSMAAISDDQLIAVANKVKGTLQGLHLFSCGNLTGKGISSLACLTCLNQLTIRSCEQVKTQGLAALFSSDVKKTLRTLHLAGITFTPELIEAILELSELQTLELVVCDWLVETPPKIASGGASTKDEDPSRDFGKELEIPSQDFSSEKPPIPDTSVCDIPGEQLIRLAELPVLQELSFSNMKVKPAVIAAIRLKRRELKVKFATIDRRSSGLVSPSRRPSLDLTAFDRQVIVVAAPPSLTESAPQPPPEIPEADGVLTNASLNRLLEPCSVGRNNQILGNENGDVIAAHDFSSLSIRGLSFTGTVTNDQLRAIVDKFPGVEVVRLYDCPRLSDSGIWCLLRLESVKRLYLGRCPGVTAKGLAHIFSSPNPSLLDAYLAGMRVDDETVRRLAQFPSLNLVDISFCPRVTWQGLRHFKQTLSLSSLSIQGCDAIDPLAKDELRRALPEMELITDENIDRSLVALAKQEVGRVSAFLPADRLMICPPELQEEAAITKYYKEALSAFGIVKDIIKDDWTGADQELQSLRNIIRVTHAIVKNMIQVGFFTDQDEDEVAPRTPAELLAYMKAEPKYIADNIRKPYGAGKVQELDFSGLDITFFPSFFLDTNWPQLKRLDLTGCTARLPENIRSRCPCLSVVIYTEEAHLEGRYVDDNSLKSIGWLPLQTLTITSCPQITLQGLQHLRLSRPLTTLVLKDFYIDPFALADLIRSKSGLKIETGNTIDPTLLQLARIEADLVTTSGWELPLMFPRDENQDGGRISAFYEAQLALYCTDKILQAEESWQQADFRCQSLLNIGRVADALRKHLFEEGAFLKNISNIPIPKTAASLIEALPRLKPFVARIKILDLSNLGLTFLPSFLLELDGLAPKQLKLQGCATNNGSPEALKAKWPSLWKVFLADDRVIVYSEKGPLSGDESKSYVKT